MPNPSIAGTERAAKKEKNIFYFHAANYLNWSHYILREKSKLKPISSYCMPSTLSRHGFHFMTTFVRFGGILNFQF